MTKKKIDISLFEQECDDSTIRKTIYNDEEIMLLLIYTYFEDFVTISSLTRIYNQKRGQARGRSWVYSKLNKIKAFGLYEEISIEECMKNGSNIHKQCLEKHNKAMMEMPIQFQISQGRNVYYYLTEKGIKWIDFIENYFKKKKGGN